MFSFEFYLLFVSHVIWHAFMIETYNYPIIKERPRS